MSKFTPEVQQIIVDAITRGAFQHVAAAAAGIAPSTFYKWLADPEMSEFSEAVTRARATARIGAETRVYDDDPIAWLKAGPGRDKASDEGWATTTKHEHTGSGGGPITSQSMDLSKLSKQELAAWHTMVSKVEASGESGAE